MSGDRHQFSRHGGGVRNRKSANVGAFLLSAKLPTAVTQKMLTPLFCWFYAIFRVGKLITSVVYFG